MIEVWIPIAIGAAFFQNLRSALQKHLKGSLSNNGAAYARFLYALPFAIFYVFMLSAIGNKDLPAFNLTFLLYCLLGSIAQILFTTLLLWMFSFRSFAVGTTFSKLEVISVAILGALILGDTLNTAAIAAIAVSTMGLVALSAGQTGFRLSSLFSDLGSKATILGLVCSLFLGHQWFFFAVPHCLCSIAISL